MAQTSEPECNSTITNAGDRDLRDAFGRLIDIQCKISIHIQIQMDLSLNWTALNYNCVNGEQYYGLYLHETVQIMES